MTVRKRPALVVFQGGVAASSPLEELVAQAQVGATLDLLATAASLLCTARAGGIRTEVGGLTLMGCIILETAVDRLLASISL